MQAIPWLREYQLGTYDSSTVWEEILIVKARVEIFIKTSRGTR
jgi:hypothetical protein